jgi:elongation factor Ts
MEIRTEVALNDPKNANKPKDILEKIVQGSLNKYFQEVTLLNQEYVKESGKKVSEYLKGLDKDLTVTAFRHVTLG